MQSVKKPVDFINTQYDAIIEDGVAYSAKLKSEESEVRDVKTENKELKCELKEDFREK